MNEEMDAKKRKLSKEAREGNVIEMEKYDYLSPLKKIFNHRILKYIPSLVDVQILNTFKNKTDTAF